MEITDALLILRPSRKKWLLLLLVFLLFVATGIWILGRKADAEDRVMAWLCIGFFGLGVPLSLYQLISPRNKLVVTKDGLYVFSLFRTQHHAWKDIERFGVAEWSQWHGPIRQRHRLIGLHFTKGSPHLARAARLQDLNAALTGFPAALPDNYGYKHQELADLLNRYLESHKGSQTPG